MDLRELMGSVMVRLRKEDTTPPGAIVMELNNALQDLHTLLRDAWNERPWAVDTLDLVADQASYDLPDHFGEVVRVERLDLGTLALPVNRVQYGQDDNDPPSYGPPYGVSVQPLQYVLMPDRKIKFLQVPPVAFADGARITYFPLATSLKLVDFADVPAIPEQFHEFLVPRALLRLKQYRSVGLADVKAFEQWSARMEELELKTLYPSDTERPPGIDEEFGYHEEVF